VLRLVILPVSTKVWNLVHGGLFVPWGLEIAVDPCKLIPLWGNVHSACQQVKLVSPSFRTLAPVGFSRQDTLMWFSIAQEGTKPAAWNWWWASWGMGNEKVRIGEIGGDSIS